MLPSLPIVEVATRLSSTQFAYLTNGPKYVPPCQSRFNRRPIDTMIDRDYEHIVQAFKRSFEQNYTSTSDQRAKDFFASIQSLVHRAYTSPVPPTLLRRAHYEHRMIRSIQRRLKTSNEIIRQTDKSKVFHLGSADDYHRKALAYMTRTNAYEELPVDVNPCLDHLRTVMALIDPLLQGKRIDLSKWKNKMRPDVKSIELAHLYFIPKPHKVNDVVSIGVNTNRKMSYVVPCDGRLDWYTIETDCIVDACGSNGRLAFSRSRSTTHVQSCRSIVDIHQRY
jgi:hypothetical protein